MKKFLISTFLIGLASFSMFAGDNVLNNPDNKAYFGVRVAGEITCPGDVTHDKVGVAVFKNGGGFEFGGIYNIPVVANFYVEPGLKFYYNTYSVRDEIINAMAMGDVDIDALTVKKFGFRIPVMAGYHFDFTDDIKLSVFTGPELEIGLKAKESVKYAGIKESDSLYGEDGGMHRADVLWTFGAGISYRQLYFGVSGSMGMLNMFSNSDASFHESRCSFSVGYNF